MALVVNATRILLRGDFVNSDQGSVDTTGLSAPLAPLAIGGPSIPDPVVQPLPVAALSTSPMAAIKQLHLTIWEGTQPNRSKKLHEIA
nr:unnamed protein product [Digitaria exilis]